MTVTISSNLVVSGSDGFDVANDSDIVVNAGIAVGSDRIGFNTDFASGATTLDNHGSIFGMQLGSQGFGVEFGLNATGTIHNRSDGYITGYTIGVAILGNGVTTTNEGTITGFGANADGYNNSGTGNHLINSGLISGVRFGVSEGQSAGDGGIIENSGTIRSDAVGILVDLQAALPSPVTATIIHNQLGGIIAGLQVAIETTDAGVLALTNEAGGRILGDIQLLAANQADSIVNQGTIAGTVALGSGNDTFDGAGGRSGAVFGEDGDDHLTGGNGNDTLVGGLGKDLLKGLGGRDVFEFAFAAESHGATADTILSFNHAQHDRIDLGAIDATPGGADNAFLFAGAQSFAAFNATHNGGVVRAVAGMVQVDIGGNGTVDMIIKTPGAMLHMADFIL